MLSHPSSWSHDWTDSTDSSLPSESQMQTLRLQMTARAPRLSLKSETADRAKPPRAWRTSRERPRRPSRADRSGNGNLASRDSGALCRPPGGTCAVRCRTCGMVRAEPLRSRVETKRHDPTLAIARSMPWASSRASARRERSSQSSAPVWRRRRATGRPRAGERGGTRRRVARGDSPPLRRRTRRSAPARRPRSRRPSRTGPDNAEPGPEKASGGRRRSSRDGQTGRINEGGAGR